MTVGFITGLCQTLTASMIQPLTLCEHATVSLHLRVQVNLWTHELPGMGRWGVGGKLAATDYCCYAECFPCSAYGRVSCTRSLKVAADILWARNQAREKPFQLTRKCPRMRLSGVPFKLWTHKSLCFTRGHLDSRRRWTVALRPHYDPNQFQNNACYITVMTLDCVIIPCRYVKAAEIYRIHKSVSSGKWLFFIISGTDLWTRV